MDWLTTPIAIGFAAVMLLFIFTRSIFAWMIIFTGCMYLQVKYFGELDAWVVLLIWSIVIGTLAISVLNIRKKMQGG